MAQIRKCINVDGPKKNVVVFDGGGVRGRFGLEVCRLLAENQPVPLSQLFSMAAGVSAGAIIATIVALGLLDDSKTANTTCVNFYTYMPHMFHKQNKTGPWLAPRYDGTGKTLALRNVLGTKTFADVLTPLVICCCQPNGKPRNFCSWDPQVRDVLLADVLDASSAAPIFFPPVQVQGTWLVDGGVSANKPLMPALLNSIEFFDRAHIRFLSIGSTATDSGPELTFAKAGLMGVFAWIGHGLLGVLLGTQDNTHDKVIQALFMDRFMRVECECDDIRIDDYSQASCVRFDKAARLVWEKQSEQILFFLKPLVLT